MPREIPFSGASRESMDITLSGRSLRIRTRYAHVQGVWTIDIFDLSSEEPVPLVLGLVIVLGVDMLAPYGLEIGGLIASANPRSRDEAKRGELGGRVRVVHYTEAELEAL